MKIIYMLLSGLFHVHQNGVIHRDIKAQNCIIDKNGKLYLIDFGMAKKVSEKDSDRVVVGTETYLAPEVFD